MSRDRDSTKLPPMTDRTVGIPFTTPLVCGAKARLAKGGAVELLVPNPSGGRGFYVMDLRAIREYCQLTVHDEMLLENLLSMDVVTPATVRRCARNVALAGAAGRDAAAAAKKAAEREEGIVGLTNYLMLMRLLRDVGIDERELQQPSGKDKAVQSEIKRRLSALTPKIGLSADEVLDTVTDIAFYASAIGFAGGDLKTRHQTVMDQLKPFHQTITRWAALENGESKERAEQIVECAIWTYDEVSPLIVDCQTWLDDVTELVRAWRDDRGDIKERFALPDWLLDSWPDIFNIWETAAGEDRAMQRTAVLQIHRLLPLAYSLTEHGGIEIVPMDTSVVRSRAVKLHEDWKTGVMMSGMRARAEAVRVGTA